MERCVSIFVFLVLIVLISVFNISGVNATVGVSPAYVNLDFEPGMKEIFTFRFYTDVDSDFKISLEGDLTEYATLSTNKLEGTGYVKVSLALPDNLDKPGINTLGVVAEQELKGEVQGFGLSGTAKVPIRIRVPYPGKYAETNFEAENINEGEDSKYSLTIKNLGTENLLINGKIDILFDDEIINSVEIVPREIVSTDTQIIKGRLGTASMRPGLYNVTSIINYGGENPAISKDIFRIGELFIEVTNHSNFFRRDKIERFEVYLQSRWKHQIDNVYANISIAGYPQKSILTPSISIKGFNEGLLTGFFDTSGIEESDFKAIVQVNYEDRFTIKELDLEFEKEINYLVIAVIVSVVVVMLLIVALIYLLFKLRSGGKGNKKKKKRGR